MNLNKATTESFFVYNKFHESMNMTLKVSTASVVNTRRLVDVPNGGSIMGGLIDTLDLPWGTGKNYPKPNQVIDRVIGNISNNGIMQSFSGFELYLTHVIAEL